MKVLSIIGIVLFSLFILAFWGCIEDAEMILDGVEKLEGLNQFTSILGIDLLEDDVSDLAGSAYVLILCELLGSIFGLILSIVGVVSSSNKNNNNSKHSDMTKLHELVALKQTGVLTDAEFDAKKRELLNY